MQVLKHIVLLMILSLVSACGHREKNTPRESAIPLDRLKAGNERFAQGHPIHPDETLQRIRELKKGQHPFVAVVSCSDSRIPPELIFDQGLGDMFTIRTAGNVIGDYELGSIEYAVEHLGCALVVVLGHEDCGAIKAFVESDHQHHEDHIQKIIDYISAEKEEASILGAIKGNPDLAVRANITHGVVTLRNAPPILNKLVKEGKLTVIGAYYDLDNGRVKFEE